MRNILAVLLILPFLQISAKDYKCEKWDVLNLTFESNQIISDPFDVEFWLSIQHEKGYSTEIPAFYNGDNKWIVRFCPNYEGKWKYKSYSDLKQFAGSEGNITVTKNTKSNEHGPIVISKTNKQKFEYADGSPYFLMAFELDWLFALDAENPDSIPKTMQIVNDLAENKFNQVVMNVYAYDANWGEREKIAEEHNFAKPNVFPYLGSNENPDYSSLNIEFFRRLDRVIEHLNEREIISHLMIYVWNKKVSWPEPESKADNLYFDYVVKRYQAYPNLIWDISKEALAYGRDDMNYITRRIDRLRKLDGHKRLLSVHDYSYCMNFPNKVDFISIQEWRPNLYNEMREKLAIHKNMPVFNIEHGGYEKTMYSIFDGAYTDPITCLDRNYQCVFAGVYSTYYWQNSSWYNIIPDPFFLPIDQQPNFRYYKNLVNIFEKYNFNELIPVQSIFTTFCLTDKSKRYIFYLPENMISLQGDMPELKGKTVNITWYDVFTGEYYSGEKREFNNGTWLGFNRHEKLTSPMAVAILEVIE